MQSERIPTAIRTSELADKMLVVRYGSIQEPNLVYIVLQGENFKHIMAQEDVFPGYLSLTASTQPSLIEVTERRNLEVGLAALPSLKLISPYDGKPLSIDVKAEGLLLCLEEESLAKVIPYALKKLKGRSVNQHTEICKDSKMDLFFGLILVASTYHGDVLPRDIIPLQRYLKERGLSQL